MEHQGGNLLEGITGSFQYLTSTGNVDFNQGTFTAITSSTITVTSSTAQEFILADTATGTPFVYSPTNLNLSASNAVVITSSPLRLKTLTNAQTSSFTSQDGDLIYNSDRAAYMAYSASAWQEIIITGFTASYASQALTSSHALTSSISNNALAFRLSTTASLSGSQDGDILFDTTGSGSFAKKYLAYSGSAWHSFVLDSDLVTSASYAITASYAETAQTASYVTTAQTASYVTLAQTASYVATAQTASYIAGANIDGTVTSASYAITASHATNFNPDATASYALNALTASHAITASYALNAGGGSSTDTGSLLTTASVASNIITFTKGDSSTFAITVDTGSGGGGGSTFPYTGSAIVSGSLIVTGSISTDSTIEATASYAISSSISTNSVNSNTNSGSISWWSGTQAEFNAISSSAELGKIYFVI